MAFHIKSTTKFKALIGFSALSVSGVAALFSVTGVSTLFKGAWLTIVLMMSILEIAKIVVASYVARFWVSISKMLRFYFILATVVLMAITSAGIFGYLSEAYQGTKGNYDVTEQESSALVAKKKNFEEQMTQYKQRINTLNSMRGSQELRLDSLYARKLTVSAKRVEESIKRGDLEIQSLNDRITALTDSVGNISTQVITKQSANIKGELGPLKFIADAFGTNMDNVVKYLILMLIFVFDPLAVLLFVSLSIMLRKEALVEEQTQLEKKVAQPIINDVKMNSVEMEEQETPEERELKEVVETLTIPTPVEESIKVNEELPPAAAPVINSVPEVSETITETIPEISPIVIEEDKKKELEQPEVKNTELDDTEAHKFYYGDETETPAVETPAVETPAVETPVVETPVETPVEPIHKSPTPEWKTANWKGR